MCKNPTYPAAPAPHPLPTGSQVLGAYLPSPAAMATALHALCPFVAQARLPLHLPPWACHLAMVATAWQAPGCTGAGAVQAVQAQVRAALAGGQ